MFWKNYFLQSTNLEEIKYSLHQMANINENPKKIIFQPGAFPQKSYYIIPT